MLTNARYLLAVDMDGTLLRDDKTIAEEDVEAIRAAPAHGIAVTIATGRLTTGALPVARELGLSTPLVCADGAVLVDPIEGVVLERRTIVGERAARALDAILEHGLAPFVFLADTIHCDGSGERHRPMVETWSRNVVVHGSLAAAAPWHPAGAVAMTLGIGGEDGVVKAAQRLQDLHPGELDTVYFSLFGSEVWAVRSLPGGCDKGHMLAELASRLALPRARVAAVGDWLNDIGMFKFAGRSFAMGHAPEVVRAAATDVLAATAARGGGVAEAISKLIGR